MGYQSKVLSSVSWMTLFRGITRGLTFVRLAILGRILTPTEFGFFGIATLLLALLEILTETGINVFLVQQKSHIGKYINSAWVVSITRGVILSLFIFSSDSFVSDFFNSPGAYHILVMTALVPLIRGFINPAIISYQKDLLFNKEFRYRTVLFIVDVFISVIAGFITRSAISFVYGLIASALVEVILSYVLIPLHPTIRFEWDKIKYIIRKGWWITLAGIFTYAGENGDNFIVGKIMGPASLGIYQIAYKFSTLPISEITVVVNQVTFPVFSKFATDKKRLQNAFVKVSVITGVLSLLLGGAILVFARPIITIVMGTQWDAAIPAVQILAVYGILRTFFGNFAPLFLSVGKQSYVAQMTAARLIGLAIFIIPSINHFGLIGAGYAMLASIFFEIPIALYFIRKVLY